MSGDEKFVEEHFYDLYETHGFAEVDLSESHTPSQDDAQTRGNVETDGKPRGKTVSEYLRESKASTKQDNALVVGWYLESVNGQDDFTPSEVEKEGKAAKVPLGVKLKRDLDKNVQKGYLHSPDQRDGEDVYWVTPSGKEHLQELGLPIETE